MTAWVIILAVTAAIVVAVVIPRLGGATPYTILTGSMKPQLPPGTLVVMKPVKPSELGVGSVITYQLASGKSTVVTHRIVSAGLNSRGERTYRTQGDANNVMDANPVLPVQIKGKLWYRVPYFGYVSNVITGKERHLAMIFVVSGLLLYAAFMFTSSMRDRFSKSRHRSSVSSS